MSSTPLKICYFNICPNEEGSLLVFGRTSEGNLVRETIRLDERIVVIEPHVPLGEYHKNIIRQYCTDFLEDDNAELRAFNAKMRPEVQDVKAFFTAVSEFADITYRRVSPSTSVRDSGIKMMEHPELLNVIVVRGEEEASWCASEGFQGANVIITQTAAETAILLKGKVPSHGEVIISMEDIDNLIRVRPFNGMKIVDEARLERALAMLYDLSAISGRSISMLWEPDLWRDVIEGYDWRLSMTEVIMKKVPAKTLKRGVFKNINGVFLDDELWKIMESHESTAPLARYLRKVRFFPGLIRTIFSIPELCLPDFEPPIDSIGIVDDLLMMEALPTHGESYHVSHSWDILAVLSPGNAWGFSEEEGFSSLGRYSRSTEFPALRDVIFRCLDISLQVSSSPPNLSRILKSFSSGIPAEALILDGSKMWRSVGGGVSGRVEDIDRDKYMKILEESIDVFASSLQRPDADFHDQGHQMWGAVHRHGSYTAGKHVEEVHGGELDEDQGDEPGSAYGSEKAVRVSPSLPEQDV